jgi:hypothetical protein
MRSVTYKYVRLQLNRSETTTFALEVAPWEVPVLGAVNGDDRIQVIGETPVTKMLPDPSLEYDRLAAKYKRDPGSGQDYVAMVYGVGQRGVDALAKEIEKARVAATVPPVQTPEYDAKDDPLDGLFPDEPATAGAGAIEIVE